MPLNNKELSRLADITWREYSRFFEPDGCVLATRVFLDVLEQLHVPAQATAVVACFYNALYAQHCRAYGCEAWTCKHDVADSGAAAVILGLPPYQRGPLPDDVTVPVKGHVVAIVDQRLMVDLTVSQASHPELDIPIAGTLGAPVNHSFIRGRAVLAGEMDHGVDLRYLAFPEDHWYAVNSPDWLMTSGVRPALVAATLACFRGETNPVYPEWLEAVRADGGRL